MGKVSKLLLSSQNKGKITELTALLTPLGIEVVSALDLTLPDVPETGKTFQENATLKALAGYAATGLPTLADDSGLCVDILDGAPGIYTARFGGPEVLLTKLRGHTNPKTRSAHFMCHLTLALAPEPNTLQNKPKLFHFRGKTDGYITLKPYGKEGFGYDPIFSLSPDGAKDGQTYAQITQKEKSETSHRGKALNKLQKFLQTSL